MTWSLRKEFDRIYSIELDPVLAARAARLFKGRQGIEMMVGDSATVLPLVLERLDDPVLFWLDAHYAGVITAGRDHEPPSSESSTTSSAMMAGTWCSSTMPVSSTGRMAIRPSAS